MMKLVGKTTEGDSLLAFSQAEIGRISLAVHHVAEMFRELEATAEVVPFPERMGPVDNEKTGADASAVAGPVGAKAGMSVVVRKPTRWREGKAKVCKVCGAPRESTPWPKGGAVCKACDRARAKEKYHAKHSKSGHRGMSARIARDVAAAGSGKKNVASAGTSPAGGRNRVREALARIEDPALDGRPREGGRVLAIRND